MKARGEQGQPSGAASDAEGSPIPSGTDQEQREETGKAHQEDAQEREPQQLEQRRQQAEAGPLTEFDPDDWFLPLELPFKRKSYRAKSKPRQWKRLRQILQAEGYHELPASVPTYTNIEAPPSMYPAKHYCDLTGFDAPYTDPKTKLRYASAALFGVVRSMPDEAVQAHLALRGAQVVLR